MDWRVHLGDWCCAREDADKGYISLSLLRSGYGDGAEKVLIECELSVLGQKESRVISLKSHFKFISETGFPKFLHLDEIRFGREDYLPKDTLTVRCKIWKGEGKVLKVSPTILRTRISIENVSFSHLVDKFSTLRPNQRKTVKTHSEKGCIVSSDVYCSEGKMIVEIKPSDAKYILCKLNISLIKESGNRIGCGEDDNRLDDERKDIQKLTLSISRQDILLKKDEYLPNDRLTLLCECGFSNGLDFEEIEGSQYETSATSVANRESTTVPSCLSKSVDHSTKKNFAFPSALEDFKYLYTSQCLTDVELKTETRSFQAHKIVLAARSTVFKAMLTSDMREKHSNCIRVDDLKDDIVQQFLIFLYSDTVENLLWNNAIQLYFAADKYQIGRLKEMCSSFLIENISTSNVTELLLLADTHYDTELKKLVEDFILQHEEQVFGSKEWEKLIETHPLLVIKTMHLKYKRKK